MTSYEPAGADSEGPAGDPAGDAAFTDTVTGDETPERQGFAAMPRRARMVFLGVLSLISLLLYGVGALALAPTSAAWPAGWAWAIRLVLPATGLVMVALILKANGPRPSDLAARVAHVLLGVGFLLFSWSLVTAVALRLPLALAGMAAPDRSRLVAVVLAVVVVGLAVWGAREALRLPRVRRAEVDIAGLDPALDGLTVAVLTDTHFDAFTTPRWSRAVVDRVNALAPDIVVHTGDLADGRVPEREDQVAPLADVAAPHRFYIAGNHEYYSDAPAWIAHMAGLGWQVLVNQHATVRDGLVVAGLDDPTGTGMPGHGPDLDAALAGAPDLPVLLLAHQPHLVATAADRVDLQVSGHTHGGQIWPFHLLVRLREPVVQGLSRHGSRTRLWTSRGTGFWGPPFRVFAPSEISLLTLSAAPVGA